MTTRSSGASAHGARSSAGTHLTREIRHMSDTNGTDENTDQQNSDQGEQQPEARYTQADLDRIVSDRLKRERDKTRETREQAQQAGKFKSEAEKLAEQVAELTRKQNDADTRAMRYGIASDHDIPKADADLFLTGMDEDTMRAQAARLKELTAQQRPRPGYVPTEGRKPTNSNDPGSSFMRELFQTP